MANYYEGEPMAQRHYGSLFRDGYGDNAATTPSSDADDRIERALMGMRGGQPALQPAVQQPVQEPAHGLYGVPREMEDRVRAQVMAALPNATQERIEQALADVLRPEDTVPPPNAREYPPSHVQQQRHVEQTW